MAFVYFSLGSNIGNRLQFIQQAEGLIALEIGKIIQFSSKYETVPWGFSSTNHFINSVLCVETNLLPEEILTKILFIEQELGRTRTLDVTGYSSRCIDIDILLYDSVIIKQEDLVIPHPLMHERNFVLVPLNEISPTLIHPIFNTSINDLLAVCSDRGDVRLFK